MRRGKRSESELAHNSILDKTGKIRWTHVGEGAYDEADQQIQKLLNEGNKQENGMSEKIKKTEMNGERNFHRNSTRFFARPEQSEHLPERIGITTKRVFIIVRLVD